MKTLFWLTGLISLGISQQSIAQLISNEAATSAGGSLVNGGNYEGFVSIGLPMVGVVDGGNARELLLFS